jgi:hypothetical protein
VRKRSLGAAVRREAKKSPVPIWKRKSATTNGHDAVQMAVLRCAELNKAGDKAGLASWKKILKNVRMLAAASLKQPGTIN